MQLDYGPDDFVNKNAPISSKSSSWWRNRNWFHLHYVSRDQKIYLMLQHKTVVHTHYLCEFRSPKEIGAPQNFYSGFYKSFKTNYEYLHYKIPYPEKVYDLVHANHVCRKLHPRARLGTFKSVEESQFIISQVMQTLADNLNQSVTVFLNSFRGYSLQDNQPLFQTTKMKQKICGLIWYQNQAAHDFDTADGPRIFNQQCENLMNDQDKQCFTLTVAPFSDYSSRSNASCTSEGGIYALYEIRGAPYHDVCLPDVL